MSESTTEQGAVDKEPGVVEDLLGTDDEMMEAVTETSFSTVVNRVLDASDVANKSAAIAADSTEHLIDAVNELRDATHTAQLQAGKARMHAVIVLGTTGFLMLMAVVMFTVMALKLQDRLGATDTAVLAVGKRIVQLNAGVNSLKEIGAELEKFKLQQDDRSNAIEKFLPQVDANLNEIRKAVTEQAAKSAKPAAPDPRAQDLQAQSRALAKLAEQVSSMQTKELQAQSRALAKLTEQVSSIQASLAKLTAAASAPRSVVPVAAAAAPPPPKAERPAQSFIQYPPPQAGRESGKAGAEAAAGAARQ